MKLDLAIERFLIYQETVNSKETLRFYKSHLKCVNAYFKSMDCNKIVVPLVSAFILDQRKKNISNSTINKRVKALKDVLKYNGFENLEVAKLREQKKRFNYLTNEELSKLVDYVKISDLSVENKLIIMLLIDTGIRRNELIHVELDNINFSNNSILLTCTKTKSDRVVYFKNYTKLLLLEYIQFDRKYLFNRTVNGVSALFQSINKDLKFKNLSPHVLRHTFATNCLNSGMPLPYLQNIMGHSDIKTTAIYIHCMDDVIKNSYNSINFY